MRRVRWSCPNGCASILASTRPRSDDVARFCLPCSAKVGRLVRRLAPALVAERSEKEESRKARQKKERERDSARELAAWTVAGLDLREELAKLWATPIAREKRTWKKPPTLKIRRCSSYPRTKLGWARPHRHLISVCDYPGIEASDIRETLAHEVAHDLVGRNHRDGQWHGVAWKTVFRILCEQAYGVRPVVEKRFHGSVAPLLEKKEAAEAPGEPVDPFEDLLLTPTAEALPSNRDGEEPSPGGSEP